ncbi:MAG TPA: DUF4388 domain-containing protein [Polyangiaceae bacterium]|nr:DUF4388 domain-containing protein [Polyangiaceae bacterium]
MKSVHPDDAAASRDLVVVVSGRSIELNALAQRLAAAGARVTTLQDGTSDASDASADFVICDLASDGALAKLETFWASPTEPKPGLVTLGSPRNEPSEPQRELLALARQRYPRPLDIQSISEEILGALRQPRPSNRAPQSGAELSYSPLKTRSSRAPRLAPPAPAAPDPSSSSHPTSSPPPAPGDEVAAPPSQKLGPPALEHSVVSPELETLLAEAERRVQAQMAIQNEPVASTPPNGAGTRLPDDVWEALAEALDDDPDNAIPEPSVDDGPPPSPLGAELGPRSPLPPGDSTVPPSLWRSSLDDDTGSHAPSPESEQTSGSQNPVTAAGNAGAPPTLGATRDVALRPDDPADDRDAQPTQAPEPPSTTPPAARPRAADARPAERRPSTPAPPHGLPTSAPPEPVPSESQSPGTLGSDDLGPPSSVAAPSEHASSEPHIELPGALVRGAPALVIGRAVRQRFTGCLAFEVDQGLRRVVFKDGDVVISASAVHGESLVSFLSQRGDLGSDTAAQIEHRIPAFGRHAGAALIARGLLEQNELWPVLRAHAEWVLSQLLLIERGAVQMEHPVPERLAAEPAVFGGATGAEVLVEVIQRVVPPAQALAFLGNDRVVFAKGPANALLAECALSPHLLGLVQRAGQVELAELLQEAEDEPMLPCVLYALGVLEVLEPTTPEPRRPARSARARPAKVPDAIDDEALRAKIQARRALVDEGDYFALLGVPRAATGYDIRRSYVELRRQFDPAETLRQSTLDLRDDLDTILEVLDEAYEILRDQQRRERYRRAIESVP